MKRLLLIVWLLTVFIFTTQVVHSAEQVFHVWKGVNLELKSGETITCYKWWRSWKPIEVYDTDAALKEKEHYLVSSLYSAPDTEYRFYSEYMGGWGTWPVKVVRTYEGRLDNLKLDEVVNISLKDMEFDGHSRFAVPIVVKEALPLFSKKVIASTMVGLEHHYHIYFFLSHNPGIGKQELDNIISESFGNNVNPTLKSRLPAMKDLASKGVTVIYWPYSD